MSMEWSTGFGFARISVAVPDDLVFALIEAVDEPPGSTGLDPYRNLELRGSQLVTLRTNVVRANEARRAFVLKEILAQLHRPHVEPWMKAMIGSREHSDEMLAVLEELLSLLELAIQSDAVVHVWGD